MTDNSKKWKPRLLSSSLPLEFDVSKILTKHSFAIEHDYSYLRQDDGSHKEFSVDIKARAFFKVRKALSDVTVLAECKYREEGKRWAFLPEIKSDFSTFTAGYTIRHENAFSIYNLDSEKISELEYEFDYSAKGTEISLSTGEVFDKDIRHGIVQLKYALPYIIKDNIEFNTFGHIDDASPFFIIPVLITNADLYIFHEDVSIDAIKKADDIDSLMKKVPYLILHNSIGPDFGEHHKNIFKNFVEELESENLTKFEEQQKEHKDKHAIYDSPLEEKEDLQNSDNYTMNKYYTQYFICSLDHFDEFITKTIKCIKGSLRINASH